MKRNYLLFLMFCVAFTCALAQEAKFKSDEIVIRLKKDVAEQVSLNAARRAPNMISVEAFDAVSERISALSVNQTFTQNFSNPEKAKELGLHQYVTVKITDGQDIESVMNQYRALEEVELVEYNYIAESHVVPNDALYGEQWGLNNTGNAKEYGTSNLVGTPGADLNLEPAWDIHTGSSSVTIAIIDSGVDGSHPEFSGRMVAGYDYHNGDSNASDDNGHGTSCAGIAAAAGNNGIGVAGVNWGAQIMPLKALGADGSGSYTAIANAITFAVDNNADVISMSLGGGSSNSALANAVDYAYAQDVLVFASRGNGNNTAANYPSAYTTVISVGGLSPCDTRKTTTSCDGEYWWGASYGGGQDQMDFVAPAARITTTDITGNGGYSNNEYTDSFNGTSSSCPFAAGVGALVRSYNPSLSVDEIRTILRETSVDIGTSGYDAETGFGRLDAEAALLAAGGTSCSLAAPTGFSASGVGNNSFNLSWNNVPGADSYTVSISGATATVSGTSYSASGLSAGTTYNCSVVANCSAGGSGAASSINVTTTGSNPSVSDILVESTFSTGFEGWADGGNNSAWYSGSSYMATAPFVYLRDNTNSSTTTSPTFNASSYDQIYLEFDLQFYLMEGSDRIDVYYYDGSGWINLGGIAVADFGNDATISVTAALNATDYNLASNAQIRFENEGSARNDYSFIDNVTITGNSGSAVVTSMSAMTASKMDTQFAQPVVSQNDLEGAIAFYPNPVKDMVSINGISETAEVKLMTLSGQIIDSGIGKEEFDMARLHNGMYLLQVITDGESEAFRIIKE